MHNDKHQRANLKDCKRFWIIGAGRFGRIAAQQIIRHLPGATITLVDKQPFTIAGDGITTVIKEGTRWLDDMFDSEAVVDWIIPAIPIHVTGEWLKLNLNQTYEIKSVNISDTWLSQLPNALPGKRGQAFVSQADFVCPDNCPESKKICTYTGKVRPMDLFRLLNGLDFPDVLPIVLRSHQLFPGVGGIYPQDLISVRDIVCVNRHRLLMIATACRCHGVVDFIRLGNRVDTASKAEQCS